MSKLSIIGWRLWWRLSGRCHTFDPDALGVCRICRWTRPVWEHTSSAGQRRIRRAHRQPWAVAAALRRLDKTVRKVGE